MLILLLVYLAVLVSCAVVLAQWSLRPPCCPVCRLATEPLPARDLGGGFPTFEVTHWCTRCARIVSRRVVQLLSE